MGSVSTAPLGEREAGSNVLLVVDPAVDARDVFVDAVTAGDERAATIVLATAASGHALFEEFDASPALESPEQLQVLDGSIQLPDRAVEDTEDVRYVPPVSEYLAQLGDQFGRALEDLDVQLDGCEDALGNRTGFYSLGPLLEYAGETELVFRFVCILTNQIEDASGQGVFVLESTYEDAIDRLEVLFDAVVTVEPGDEEPAYSVATTI